MKKLLLLLVFLTIGIFIVLTLDSKKQSIQTPTQKVKIGLYNGDSSALAFFAKEKGFFKKENLDIEFKLYKSGRDAMAGMLNGEVDYSNSTEYVALKNSYKNKDFKILGSMATAIINEKKKKKSSGIYQIKDMKNKKIGTTFGTAAEYFTGIFLLLNNLEIEDITLVDINVGQRDNALESDKVDALFAWEPFFYNMKQKYKDELKYFEMPAGFEFYFIFTVNNKYHEKYPQISSKIVKALIKTERYMKKNKAEFNDFVKNYFNFDNVYSLYTLQRHHFSFTFPYPLTTTMYNQAKWLEKNKLVIGEATNIESLFDTTILNNIDRTKVTILDR